jgi:recombination protein RecA
MPSARRPFSLPEKYMVAPPAKKGLHGGGFGSHPRNEVKGLSDAVSGLFKPETLAPRCAEPQRRERPERETFEPHTQRITVKHDRASTSPSKSWNRIEQALRTTDLLLQGGGFSAIVLDMGSIAPEYASRVALSMWFRYRAAAEQTQASILLLTQHSCAKSSVELLLRLQPGNARRDEFTIFTGIEHEIEVVRRRFTQVAERILKSSAPILINKFGYDFQKARFCAANCDANLQTEPHTVNSNFPSAVSLDEFYGYLLGQSLALVPNLNALVIKIGR